MSDYQFSSSHVLVVGGGFAGVACAKRLAEDQSIRVTLFDKNGVHQFQPLLYQVATAELTSDDVAFDLQEIFRGQTNVEVLPTDVVAVDPRRHTVTIADGSTIAGDVLVLAAGAQPNFFGTPGAPEFSYPLYSLGDAERVRSRVLQLFADAADRPRLIEDGALNIVVVGAGATGVEIGGAMAELVHDVMPQRYEAIEASAARIIVVDLGHSPLGAFSDSAHAYATKQLDHRGVELMLGAGVVEVAPDHVTLSGDTTIPTHLTIWGGGEMAAPIIASSGLPVGRGGRVDVEPDLSVKGFPGVYVIGDAANIPGADGKVLPQLGSVAQQAGAWAGRNILDEHAGIERTDFEYHDKGIMAMIGCRAAVAEIGEHRHELHGRVAFAAWLGVHAALLSNIGAEMHAFMAWAEDFYVRPHHRSAALLDPSTIDTPRISWGGSHAKDEQPKDN
jgi:NADH dehydrogenase